MADLALVVLSILAVLAGLVGAVLPVIPGPLLSVGGLLLFFFTEQGGALGMGILIVMGLLAVVMMALDYVVPALGAKKFGASRAGIWGSIIGMIVGFFLLPGWGLILGTLAGAVIGELSAGQSRGAAFKAGWGVFVGNLFGIGLKLAYGVAALVILVQALV